MGSVKGTRSPGAVMFRLLLFVWMILFVGACAGNGNRSSTSLSAIQKRTACAHVRPAASKQKSKRRRRVPYTAADRGRPASRRGSKRSISLGMTREQVEQMCGEPDKSGYVRNKKGVVRERWVYRIEERKRARRIYLYFRRGELVENDVFVILKDKEHKRRKQPPRRKRIKRSPARPLANSGTAEAGPPGSTS